MGFKPGFGLRYYTRYILLAGSLKHNESYICNLRVDEIVKKVYATKKAQVIIKMAGNLATSRDW